MEGEKAKWLNSKETASLLMVAIDPGCKDVSESLSTKNGRFFYNIEGLGAGLQQHEMTTKQKVYSAYQWKGNVHEVYWYKGQQVLLTEYYNKYKHQK